MSGLHNHGALLRPLDSHRRIHLSGEYSAQALRQYQSSYSHCSRYFYYLSHRFILFSSDTYLPRRHRDDSAVSLRNGWTIRSSDNKLDLYCRTIFFFSPFCPLGTRMPASPSQAIFNPERATSGRAYCSRMV